MKVEVLPWKGRDVVNQNEVDMGVYQIRIDGKWAGTIGYQEGARPTIHKKMSPMEADEITRQVAEQLNKQKPGSAVIVPDAPTNTEERPSTASDFD